MKKFRFLFALFTLKIAAQTVITAADITDFNEIRTHFSATSVTINSGAAGANVIWDFSSLPFVSSFPIQFQSVTTAPFASNVTNSNYFTLLHLDQFSYYNLSADKYEYLASSHNTTLQLFPNPETMLSFPFSFNSSFTDTYQTTPTSPTTTKFVIYDGYGTVITPFNIYTNCVRLKTTYSNSSTVFYEWYLVNPLRYICNSHTNNGSTFFSTIQRNNLNLNDFNTTAISIYPNPATDFINIAIQNNTVISDISIADMTGKIVLYQNKNTENINIQNLSSGLYFLSVYADGKKITTKFLKK